jgi:N-acetylglucosaminyldiphosphoundecaprenol N-acetyl-beta-D-mannosaminyltransferase
MRTTLLDLPIDILSAEETVARALDAMQTGRRCQHVAINVAKIVNARRDAELARDVAESDIVGIDGMGVVFALRLLGHPVPERVAGIDLFHALIEQCATRGLRPYLLGATPEVLAATEVALLRRYPTLKVAGRHHGYFRPDQERRIRDEIRASEADCLFIAMPSPRKERFLHAWRDSLGVPFLMGVGGTFDVVAGKVSRAPLLMQRLGLEWLHRLAQEPRRMAGRYLRTNAVFLGLVLRELLRARLAGRPVARATL